MASSNRHWPSLFKSKPCSNNHHHQWQHDVSPTSLLSNPCQKPPYGSSGLGAGGEERTPEPKPRWNPKPEQIRILEAIFNSGMVNPPRDEIRKIRVQLQEYGQVGDANVFYWFQNRKSRSKHKQRQLQSRQKPPISATPASTTEPVTTVAASSSSSSSDPSNSSGTSSTSKTSGINGTTGMIDLSNSPTNSVNQTYFHHHHHHPPPSLPPSTELQQEFLLFQGQNHNNPIYYNLSSPDLSLSCLTGLTRPVPSGFWSSDLISQQEFLKTTTTTDDHHHHYPKRTPTTTSTSMNFNSFYGATAPATSSAATITSTSPSFSSATAAATTATHLFAANATKEDNSSTLITSPFVDMLQGVEFGSSGVSRMVVFINEVAFEVGTGNLNVKEAFGMEAVLLHSSGLPVLVDDWGVTLQPLQHGASYFLV